MNVPTLAQVRKRNREDAPPICRQSKLHTPSPEGYLAWHEWAEKKSKTHRQERCPGCGLWAIWTPVSKDVKESSGD